MSFSQNNFLFAVVLPLTGALLLIALAGYGVFLQLPEIIFATQTRGGLYLLAAVAGVGALFSPCSFPLLMTLLGRSAGERSQNEMWQKTVGFTLGITLFLVLLGSLVGLGAGALVTGLSFVSPTGRLLRFTAGFILIAFGLWQLRGQSLNIQWLNRLLTPLWERQFRWQRERKLLSHALYGFGYILAGFGWTGPILAGLVIHSVAVADAEAAFYAFVIAAGTIAVLMFGLAVIIGIAKERLIKTAKRSPRLVKRWGGTVLLLVGIWLILLALWAAPFAPLLGL